MPSKTFTERGIVKRSNISQDSKAPSPIFSKAFGKNIFAKLRHSTKAPALISFVRESITYESNVKLWAFNKILLSTLYSTPNSSKEDFSKSFAKILNIHSS